VRDCGRPQAGQHMRSGDPGGGREKKQTEHEKHGQMAPNLREDLSLHSGNSKNSG
jgi:hypothetical protein